MTITTVSTIMINQTGNVAFTGSNVSLGAIDNLHITGGTSGQVLTTDGTGNVRFDNQRINPRMSSSTSALTLTPNFASSDIYAYTALATNLVISVPIGNPVDGDKLTFRFLDNGTTRTITFTGGVSGGFRPIGISLTPSGSNFTFATTGFKLSYVGFIYNANAERWDGIALTTES